MRGVCYESRIGDILRLGIDSERVLESEVSATGFPFFVCGQIESQKVTQPALYIVTFVLTACPQRLHQ